MSESRQSQYQQCEVCASPERYEIEQRYLMGETRAGGYRFTRAEVEAHISHAVDPQALKMALGMASASAVAARLRMLEATTNEVLDKALADGKPATALKAIREVRETVKLMAQLGAHLAEKHSGDAIERSDLDDAIAEALRSRGVNVRGEPEPSGPLQLEAGAVPQPEQQQQGADLH